ncbi:protein suppressor of sable isoform X2 [Chelonus insularis]|uniref:protein suppressor of sable isoform X2 n=1 Tax=Chelonus insularis TaxID=460826 RepID=UPI00158A72DF|nr:protein suppressor of sable isoform X2 [Chelonus insularis]
MTSNADNDDLEDGEIPSDEDDEPVVITVKQDKPPEPSKESSKSDSSKEKSDSKSSKSKSKSSTNSSSSSKVDRFGKYKNPSEDWAGDVEKAIKAVLDENKSKDNKDSKSKSSSSSKSSRSSRNKKRIRDEKEERDRDDDRNKDQKKRKLSDDENVNEDDDEMLFVRGASPVRREAHESPPLSLRHREERPRDLSRDRSRDRDSYDRDSRSRSRSRDSDERNRDRHRDEKRNNRGSSSRRSGKSERGIKSKSRSQRSDRSGRRNQDHGQDSDSICVYYMQGKCHRGDDCPFSHNALPPRKMELCKFYLMDCCAKRDKCLYMHHDFPCKFFHTGLKCVQGDNCKFSHEPLNDQVKNILLKHLETAPKEILGEFPRLSREGALLMINNTARKLAQGQDASSAKIPSLFDVTLPAPQNLTNEKDDDATNHLDNAQNRLNSTKDKKVAGKKTRWGSDDDRVPLEQIMLLQSVSQLGLHLPNVALSLAVQQQLQQHILLQQCIANMEYYNEIQGSPSAEGEGKGKKDDSTKSDEEKLQGQKNLAALAKDIDLRQLIANCPKSSLLSIANEAANLEKSKFDEESDHDDESDLVIAVPADEEDKNKEAEKDKDKVNNNDNGDSSTNKESSVEKSSSSDLYNINNQELLPKLPKKTQELFLRIQQQQRAATDSIGNADDKCAVEDLERNQEDWYSDDDGDNDDDDDDEGGNLQIVIKDNLKDESEKSDLDTPTKESPPTPQPASIPQPAVIVDKIGDVSKIDISAEVTKLLSSIKPHNVTSLKKSPGLESPPSNDDRGKESDHGLDKLSKSENGSVSPKSFSMGSGSVSRDPRMSRDPRQRRNEDTKCSSPSRSDSKKESRPLRLETSIYSSGIISTDSPMDTDLRSLDQDRRRQDMDLRQRFPQDFGDTDLRVGSGYSDTTRSDVDLRQMLSLPFKPAPSHVPCTEIDASIASHPPVTYKVYVVDIPRPNYTGLKLNKNDALVKYDPRLRKIFRLSQSEVADSPMSPPPAKNIPDTPKSPPQVRTDPRRKALEMTIPTTQVITSTSIMSTNLGPSQQQSQDLSMNMGGPGIQGPGGIGMPLGQNQMMGGIAPLAILGGSMQPPNMTPMAMGGIGGNVPNIGPNGPPLGPNQMGFDGRYGVQRNGGPGLLGPAPGLGFNDHRDMGPNFNEGPAYSGGNFGNFGPGPGPNEPMMGFGPGGPNNMNNMNNMNFGGNNLDWPTGNSNPVRRGGRVRRRNRNRNNAGSRGNRSPQ